MDDDDELNDLLLLNTFCVAALDVLELIETEEHRNLHEHIKEQRRLCRSLPSEKTRPTWMGFCNRVSDTHFRRQFRMSREVFNNLCSLLCVAAGEGTFRPENSVISTHNAASLEGRGGLIPGEIKTALSIRLLAGGSYLDLMPLFDVSVASIYAIFNEFLDWVLQAFSFPLAKHIQEEDSVSLFSIAQQFSYSSNGVLSGIIGALDGIAIRIRSPQLTEVSDPGNYYCRKGFFALNVQAICDRSKRFLWCYTSNKGSTHDSSAFTNSRLYSLLTQKASWLEGKGYYMVGDSAYNITPFLLVPFSTDEVRQDPSGMFDAFNFFLSSSRIYIECAFGELVFRWGILWRTLNFNLVKSQKIVQVCMLLHNHIKDQQDKDLDVDSTDWQPNEGTTGRHERAFPLVTDNNELAVRGRRSTTNESYRTRGEAVRKSIAIQLHIHDLRRPMNSGMRYNQYGHVYFDG
jgi:hypothetical protein